jgi:hypothetical protein
VCVWEGRRQGVEREGEWGERELRWEGDREGDRESVREIGEQVRNEGGRKRRREGREGER